MGNTRRCWEWRVGTLLLLVAVFAGCDRANQGPTGPAAKLRERPVESTAAKTGQMPSDEECREFAVKMEDAVARGDLAAFNALIDWDAILESATGGISGIESIRRNYEENTKQIQNMKGGIGNTILSIVALGGSYQFLRVAKEKKSRLARFRLYGPNGGLNYHDFILLRQADGQTKAIDIHIYLSGELLSKSFRRDFLPLVAHKQRSVFDKLTGAESDFIKHMDQWRKLVQATQAGQSKRALDIYERLPESLKKEKNILLVRLQAARKSGNERAYSKAIEDLEKYFPNDPCRILVSIDGYVMREEYDKAVASIEQLNNTIGGDPILQVMLESLKDPQYREWVKQHPAADKKDGGFSPEAAAPPR